MVGKIITLLLVIAAIPLSAAGQRHFMDNEELGIITGVSAGSHELSRSLGFGASLAISPYFDLGYSRFAMMPRESTQPEPYDYTVVHTPSAKINVLREHFDLPLSLSFGYGFQNEVYKGVDEATNYYHNYSTHLSGRFVTENHYSVVAMISYTRVHASSASDMPLQLLPDNMGQLSFDFSYLIPVTAYSRSVITASANVNRENASLMLTIGYLMFSREEFNP